jgi:predicted DNA-binding transcriptional regulator AlpA
MECSKMAISLPASGEQEEATQLLVPARNVWRAAGLSDTSGYQTIRAGTFPLKTVKIGAKHFVSRVAFERLINGEPLAQSDIPDASK